MPATVAGVHLGPDIHANRPAANAAGQPIGALYSCTTHSLIYKTDGSSWSTYATLGVTGTTITTKDEGGTLSATVTTLDFVGAGVTAAGGGATTTITIPGGGTGSGPLGFLYAATIAR